MLSLPHLPPRDELWTSSPFRHQPPDSLSHPNHGQHHNAHIAHGGHLSHHPHGGPINPSPHLQQQQQQQQAAGGGGGGSHHNHNHQQQSIAQLHNSQSHPHAHHHSAALASLAADEALIVSRKLNVARFGAVWLRPPGVAKTFQALWEEEAERREVQEAARREMMFSEMARAQQQQQQQQAQAQGAAGAQTGTGQMVGGAAAGELPVGMLDQDEGMEERDMDADIPEAEDMVDSDEDEDDDDDDDDDDEEEEEEEGEEESFLEGSFVGGDGDATTRSFLEAEDAELDGRAQDRRDLGLPERDLDDDIPEAADTWEHTDSDAELDTDEEEDDDNFGASSADREDVMQVEQQQRTTGSAARQATRVGGLFSRRREVPRSSIRTSLGSSILGETDEEEVSGVGSPLMRQARNLFSRSNRGGN